MKGFLTCFLLSLNAIAFAVTPSDTLLITGSIYNSLGEEMPAVIVEQLSTKNYTLSDKEGKFELLLLAKSPQKITVSFIGYHKQTISINPKESKDLTIILDEIEDAHLPQMTQSKLPRMSYFTINLGYEYYDSRFDNFTELKTEEIALMNKLDHFFTIGIAGCYRNIYALFNWGFSPTHTQDFAEYNYKHSVESGRFLLKLGYTFPTYQGGLLLTPTLGVTRTIYSEYMYPYDTSISLSEFIKEGSAEIKYRQYCGIIGLDGDFRLAGFGNRKQHDLYLSAGIGYIFKLHSRPYIKSNKTFLTSDNEFIQNGLYFNLSLKYYYIIRNKKNK
ncbi:MAG: hypothetical protein EOM76_06785 [Sphingobacteriia bacterium]|nr:hypothetical protein [Sphingobacteriia bacterium]